MFQTCHQCTAPYEVTDKDLAFYDRVSPILGNQKFSVPLPKCCPQCRQQRRLAWRNEQNLYRRACDLCQRNIVSVHQEGVKYPVYCVDCWWSDKWNPLDFGMPLDTSRPFLDQFRELQSRVPQLAIQNDNGIGSENSEYCYDISRAKNCYRVIGSWYIEECYYSLNVNRSKFVVDCNTVSIDSELVYESLDSQRLYHCAYLQNCEGCSDCFFGFDLKGCSHCIACFGLRQKRFHIFNQAYTEEDYKNKLKEFDFGSFQTIQRLRAEFDAWALQYPRRAANLQNCEDSQGNNLFNCKGVLGYSVFNSEYSRFIDRSDGPKCCYDLINSGSPQWCYDCVTPDDSYLILFSVWCWKSKQVLYSDNCHSSENLCGCISLRRNQYCILNQQYSKQEYEAKTGEIIQGLALDGYWGEHLPIHLSPFAYNESAAAEYYPLTESEVRERGWRWTSDLPEMRGRETIRWAGVPDNILDADDTNIDQVFSCIVCEGNFKLIAHELHFYRKMPVPLPRLCPRCRHLARFKRKTPTALWTRQCDKCKKEVQTTYSSQAPEIIWCDKCYFAEVY